MRGGVPGFRRAGIFGGWLGINSLFTGGAFRFGGSDEGGGQLFVKDEEEFHPLAFAGERVGAITLVHGAIQFLVRFLERGRRGERIVEIGERGGGTRTVPVRSA